MRQKKTSVMMVVAAACLMALGCGLDDTSPAPYKPPPGNGIQEDPNKANNPKTTGGQQVQPPVVDQQPNSACTTSIPITGKGPAGASILVKGGLEPISTDAHSVTGRFCVDVKLLLNAQNSLKVYSLDPDLGLSQPTAVTIMQQKCSTTPAPTPQPTEKSRDVAIGAKVTSSDDPDTGLLKALTDGNTTTSARFSGGWLGVAAGVWVMVDLGKLVEVDKVVLQWIHSSNSSDKYYASRYTLLVAGGGTPGDPSTDNPLWTQVAKVTSGTGGSNSHSVTQGSSLIQYVAVILDQDGADWTWSETFDLAEIEVWDVPKKSTASTVDPHKTCSNVGVGF